MQLLDLLLPQLIDPFRIGLLLALVVTMLRTREATGVWVPLAAGVLFVAVIIPVAANSGPLLQIWPQVAVGLVANLVILGLILAVWRLVARLRA